MSDEFRRLCERNERIEELILRKKKTIGELEADVTHLAAERMANKLRMQALSYGGDSEQT